MIKVLVFRSGKQRPRTRKYKTKGGAARYILKMLGQAIDAVDRERPHYTSFPYNRITVQDTDAVAWNNPYGYVGGLELSDVFIENGYTAARKLSIALEEVQIRRRYLWFQRKSRDILW